MVGEEWGIVPVPRLKKETPVVLGVRELAAEDLRQAERKMAPVVKKLRDRHHHLAKLVAMGLRPWEIAERGGFALNYVSLVQTDPAFKELVAQYRSVDLAAFRQERDEYYATLNHNRNMAARQINDQLEEAEESGEKISLGNLIRVHADAADRTGYGKQTNYTVKLDFAAELDRAIAEAKKVKESRTLTLVANSDQVPGQSAAHREALEPDGAGVEHSQGLLVLPQPLHDRRD